MNVKIIIFLLLLVFCFFPACDFKNLENTIEENTVFPTETKEAEYQKISAEQAKRIMDDGDFYILLDVRTEEEFKEKRIANAILIPDYEIGERVENELTDKNARILVYCRSGRRSALAAKEMIELGYTGVYDFGGIIDWKYETVSG